MSNVHLAPLGRPSLGRQHFLEYQAQLQQQQNQQQHLQSLSTEPQFQNVSTQSQQQPLQRQDQPLMAYPSSYQQPIYQRYEHQYQQPQQEEIAAFHQPQLQAFVSPLDARYSGGEGQGGEIPLGCTSPPPQTSPTLPLGWSSHDDPSSGLTYYYHAESGRTQWHFPIVDHQSQLPLQQRIDGPDSLHPTTLFDTAQEQGGGEQQQQQRQRRRRRRQHRQEPLHHLKEELTEMDLMEVGATAKRYAEREGRPMTQQDVQMFLRKKIEQQHQHHRQQQQQESLENSTVDDRSMVALEYSTTYEPSVAMGHNTKLNKDYLAMAREYALAEPYRDKAGHQLCLLCQREPSSAVFFPCGHKCVCTGCIRSNRIMESGKAQTMASGPKSEENWSFCPLCNDEIKRMLPHTGDEEKRYWAWVNEVKPPLPHGFKRRFKNNAKRRIEGEIKASRRERAKEEKHRQRNDRMHRGSGAEEEKDEKQRDAAESRHNETVATYGPQLLSDYSAEGPRGLEYPESRTDEEKPEATSVIVLPQRGFGAGFLGRLLRRFSRERDKNHLAFGDVRPKVKKKKLATAKIKPIPLQYWQKDKYGRKGSAYGVRESGLAETSSEDDEDDEEGEGDESDPYESIGGHRDGIKHLATVPSTSDGDTSSVRKGCSVS